MTRRHAEEPYDGEPLRAADLLDLGLEGLELPKRDGATLDEWLELVTDPTARYYATTAVDHFRRASYDSGRHWLHQAATAAKRASDTTRTG
jgi:hypothetical protein